MIYVAGATTVFPLVAPVAFNLSAATGANPCMGNPVIHFVFMRPPPLHAAGGGAETLALPTGNLIDVRAALPTSRGIRLAL